VEVGPAGMPPWGSKNIGPGKPFTDTEAKWIWSDAFAFYNASFFDHFETFTTIYSATWGAQALLYIIADDFAEVNLNGEFVAQVKWGWDDSYAPYAGRSWPLVLTLNEGNNMLFIRVANSGGGAGLLASVTSPDGSTVLTRTSSEWRSLGVCNPPPRKFSKS
jgi:hypothetical protein